MAERRLPRPSSSTDMYLSAVHDRLGELNDLLRSRLPERPRAAQAPAGGQGRVELREPSGDPGRGDADVNARRSSGPAPARKAPAARGSSKPRRG